MQDILCIPQIEVQYHLVENQTENQIANITNASTCPRAHNQFGEGEKVNFSSNDYESQSFSLHSRNDDDWEKMYSNDDGTFIVSICHFT